METAEEWNARVPVGTPVRYWPIRGHKQTRDIRTRSAAWMLGGHTLVVMIDDQSGGVAVSHLRVLPQVVATLARGDQLESPVYVIFDSLPGGRYCWRSIPKM